MSRSEFDVAGEYVSITEYLGKPLLITPREHVKGITTVHGEKDAVIVDFVDLESGEEQFDVMVFQGRLIAEFRRRLKTTKELRVENGVASTVEVTTARRVLGTIAKGQAEKKGQNAPYILEPVTDLGILATASEYHSANPVPAPAERVVSQTLAAPAPQSSAGAAVQAPAPVTTASAADPTDDPWAAE